MTTTVNDAKNEFLDYWNIPRDTPEAEAAWEAKCNMAYKESAAVHIFREGFFEHIAAEPIYIKSMKQLKEETRSRGLVSHYAEG